MPVVLLTNSSISSEGSFIHGVKVICCTLLFFLSGYIVMLVICTPTLEFHKGTIATSTGHLTQRDRSRSKPIGSIEEQVDRNYVNCTNSWTACFSCRIDRHGRQGRIERNFIGRRKRLGVSRVRLPIFENESICFCSEEEQERLYRSVENGDLRNMNDILSSGKANLNRVYEDKELICGKDRIRVEIFHTVYRMFNGVCLGALVDVDTCCSVAKRN